MLGLSKDYSAFITFVMSRLEPSSLVETEALLMDLEERIGRFGKIELSLV